MLYCVVCYYREDLTGNFTIDFIFKNKKMAVETVIEYNKVAADIEPRKAWAILYVYEGLYIKPGNVDDYHVYLDSKQHTVYIFVSEQNLPNFQYQKIPLPPISTKIPDEFII